MKQIILITAFFCLVTSYAQKATPEQLLNQKFPDSITKFQLQNINEEKVSFSKILEKHKGKKVVLDFWASWCKTCRKGMPSLQALQKETENKNIDYVFISLDKTPARWKSAIDKMSIKGDHYLIAEGWKKKSILTNYIDLDDIPRYMILDESGKIIFVKTVKATDEKFRAALLK